MAQQTYNTVAQPEDAHAETFRCKVAGDVKADFWMGSKRAKVLLRETCGSGFTIGLPFKVAKKVKCGKRYELHFDNRRIEVMAESFAETVGGEARLRLGTVKEHEPKEQWAFRLPFTSGRKVISHDSMINSTVAYGGFVLVLFCVMALPGLGEDLGTAPRIKSAIELMSRNIAEVFYSFVG